jgi:hypothetical protein
MVGSIDSAQKNTVAILDDEPDRLDAMIPLLRDRYPTLRIVTFDNAPDMIRWLSDHLAECVLLCLDHDLGSSRMREGMSFDPGIGRDVVDILAMEPPTCPVVIHSTNKPASLGMELALQEAEWSCSRVTPYEDLLWVHEVWIGEVVEAIGK